MWVLWYLEKVYNRVSKESLWQVLRIYNVAGKVLKVLRVCIYIHKRKGLEPVFKD